VTLLFPAPATPTTFSVALVLNGVESPLTCTVSARIGEFTSALAAGAVPVPANTSACLVIRFPGSSPPFELSWVLTHGPNLSGAVSVDDGRSLTRLDPLDIATPTSPVDPNFPGLSVADIDAIFNPTAGGITSPGSMQATLQTAHEILMWLYKRAPDVLADIRRAIGPLADTIVKETLDGLHKNRKAAFRPGYWLAIFNAMLDPSVSIPIGTANVRRNYEQRGTRFDMPAAGPAYNTGSPGVGRGTEFGFNGVVGYPGRGSKFFHAARAVFAEAGFVAPANTTMVRFLP
jgi:hypothetical protein